MNDNDKLIFKSQDAVTETIKIDKIAPIWYIFFVAILALIILSFTAINQKRIALSEKNALAASAALVVLEELEALKAEKKKMAVFNDVAIEAQAAYVFDVLTNKTLYVRNEEMRMPLASLTKVMTALIVSDYLDNEEIVTITLSDTETEGVSHFYVGEKWKMKNLLDFTLITSSNDGSTALARTAGNRILIQNSNIQAKLPIDAFVEVMNMKASQIGLTNTVFYNPTGLDINQEKGGAYGTAHDMARLFTFILKEKPLLLGSTQTVVQEMYSENNFIHVATNTNEEVQSIPSIIASKTGFTDLAGGNLGVIFDSGIGTPIVIVVLGSGIEGRFTDVKNLVWTSLDAVSIQ